MQSKRLFIHVNEVAQLEDCSERTAIRRLRRIKFKGKVTFAEYAKSRNITESIVLKKLGIECD